MTEKAYERASARDASLTVSAGSALAMTGHDPCAMCVPCGAREVRKSAAASTAAKVMKWDALPSAGAVPLPRPNYLLRYRPRRRKKRERESWLEELSLDGDEGSDRIAPRRALGGTR
jgi:hypothetical protein